MAVWHLFLQTTEKGMGRKIVRFAVRHQREECTQVLEFRAEANVLRPGRGKGRESKYD